MEVATILDDREELVAVGRRRVLWSRPDRVRLGEYDYGEVGYVLDAQGAKTARFKGGRIELLGGDLIGSYDAFAVEETSGLPSSTRKALRLGLSREIVGWCIGYPGAAAAAVALLFSHRERGGNDLHHA